MAANTDKAQEAEQVGISLRARFEQHKKTVVGVAGLLAVVVVGAILYGTFRSKAREDRWTELVSTTLYNPYAAGPSLELLEKRGDSDILPHVLLNRAKQLAAADSFDAALADLKRLKEEYPDHFLNSLPASERYSLVDEFTRWIESEKNWLATHKYQSPQINSDRVALVETSMGAFWVGFLPDLAPKHVEHFIAQAKAGAWNGTSVTSLKSTRFEFGGEASRDDDPFNDQPAAIEQPLAPESSRFKVRPERGMVSACEIEGGSSPSRLAVAVLEDSEMDKRQTVFGRVLTDRFPNLETLDAIAKADTYGTSNDPQYKDTAKYGPVEDHPVKPVRIERISIWSEGKIEDGHTWDIAAVVKPEPKPLGEKPAGEKPAEEKSTEEKPAEEAPAGEKPADSPPQQPADETPGK